MKTDLQVGGRQLAGGPLPKLDGLGVKINSKETKEKRVLVCFFDMNQRPSRHYIMELTKRAEELKEEGIAVVCIQASSVEQQKLDDWISKHSMAFSVGMIEANEEKVRFKWGVRSLPWLILTDAA
ncbi:MAG: redoxin domain-containing protein, partial [Planctomycetota bacterium]